MSNLLMEPWVDEARHQADIAAWESRFPICEYCGEHIIEGEEYISLSSDEHYHTECFIESHSQTMPDWRLI